jgi:hypothetical protein
MEAGVMPKLPSEESAFGERLQMQLEPGTDEIEIAQGASSPGPGGEEETAAKSMADVRKRVAEVKYLVKGWIPFGMVTGVVAEPGIGKSAFVLFAIAGPVITGADWFNLTKGPEQPGYVLWCSTEYDAAINLARLKAWGFPDERILTPLDDELASISLTNPDHLAAIEDKICRYKVKLFVIDSLRGAHGEDENNSRIGQNVQAIAAIAERTGAAGVIVHHTRKLEPGEELTANSIRGSNAIVSMFRSTIGIDRPDPDSDWCRGRQLKENLGLAPKPVGFLITSDGIDFGPAPDRPRKATKTDEAAEWLLAHMQPGVAHKADELIQLADADGFAKRTIQRAATKSLHVTKAQVRDGSKITGWTWQLPDA